jgi:hypothetical protein
MLRSRRLLLAVGLLAALLSTATALALERGPGLPGLRREAAPLTAQGTAFTYQGRLTDGGNPANATYDIRFILWDSDAGGAQVGSTVTKDDVVVTNGLFTVSLDFGANAFDGNARWLEIAARAGTSTGTFVVLSPRQPITSAPYAIFADTAASLTVPVALAGSSTGTFPLVDVAQSSSGIAIHGGAGTGVAIRGTTDTGTAISGVATGASGVAGDFQGDVQVAGDVVATGEVQVTGNVFRQYGDGASGFKRATPLAYGVINADGTIVAAASTPNFTAEFVVADTVYRITIDGEEFSGLSHVAVVTPIAENATTPILAMTDDGLGDLVVRLMNLAASPTPTAGRFQFVVFAP